MPLTRREFLSTASVLVAGARFGIGIRAGIGGQKPITLLDRRWSVGGEGITHQIDGPFSRAGDLMVFMLMTNGATEVYLGTGQTIYHSEIASDYRVTLAWYFLNGTETSFVFTTEHPTDSAWAYATYSGVDPIQPFAAPSDDGSTIATASIPNKED